jgi:phosphatidylglycerol---prolipoprotein diacylglyceryl transferase
MRFVKELFSIGPIHIYFFGLMIAIGIISALFFAIWKGKSRGIEEDTIVDIAMIVVLSGVIGARLFYVLFYNPAYYFTHPKELFQIYEGGLSIHGGIFTAVAAGYIYCKKKKISFFKLGDIVVIALALAQGIGRVGCDVFGKAMTQIVPWGVKIDGQILHPAQVYEFILDYILFFILWRRSEKQKYEGELFGIYLIAFPIIRGIVEFFRINPTVWGPFSISHLLSVVLMIPGFIVLKYVKRKPISEEDKAKGRTASWKQFISLVLLIIVSMIIFYTVQQ